MEKTGLKVSLALKDLNKQFRRNYTVSDVAEKVGVSRETLSRLTTDSSFRLIYNVCEVLYDFYPEMNGGSFNFSVICLKMSDDRYFWV